MLTHQAEIQNEIWPPLRAIRIFLPYFWDMRLASLRNGIERYSLCHSSSFIASQTAEFGIKRNKGGIRNSLQNNGLHYIPVIPGDLDIIKRCNCAHLNWQDTNTAVKAGNNEILLYLYDTNRLAAFFHLPAYTISLSLHLKYYYWRPRWIVASQAPQPFLWASFLEKHSRYRRQRSCRQNA